MVSSREIRVSNALINDATVPRVAVFVGGTSGVGKATVEALVTTGASVKIYLVGRKSSYDPMHAFIHEMQATNPRAEVIWTEGEISLLAETKRICEVIKTRESRVDLLFLSAGYAPLGVRRETSEGIEFAQSLEYYSRILFIRHLLPLLRKSEAGRVVSVLGGGMERASAINLNDLDLKKPRNFSGLAAQTQYVAMNTTALDMLANQNPDVTFVHSWPGWVNTGNARRGLVDPNSVMGWFVRLIIEPLVRLIGLTEDESGQRHLFQSTSAVFGGRGIAWQGDLGMNTSGKPANGLFLVNFKCNSTPNVKVMAMLREKAQQKVWDHTQEVVGPYL
ncbi:hypothetical protein GGR50DRAFT_52447 [Xylaria sp. CBS 124048]|nr:hypothetical protein GGR50DRAFT_52447 [Xylaria sp. CBS 124048]